MILSLQKINKSFGSVVVAEDLSLELKKGGCLGIIGPNGAGKTSLFHLIAGNLKVDSGSIFLEEEEITDLPPNVRCKMGIGRSYQIPQPFEKLTVFENLLVAAVFGQETVESECTGECAEILEITGLISKANELAGSLSLLSRKRLELAKALATNPKLLLLDEIAGGLTEGECLELVKIIQAIKKKGVTIIWIEHLVSALLAVVEKLLVVNMGQKLAYGDPKKIIKSKKVKEIYIG